MRPVAHAGGGFEPTAEGPRVSQDGTSILFGLRGVKVRGVDRKGRAQLGPDVRGAGGRVECAGGRMVHLLTDDPSEGACPACGVVSTSVRQRRTMRPRDLPYGEEALLVRWHKTQWTCRERACSRTAFSDQIAELPAGARVTGRFRRHVAVWVTDGLAVSVAGGARLSWPISHAAFVLHAQALLTEPAPVAVLGIDETRRGRPVWTQHPDTRRWSVSERFKTKFVDLAAAGPARADRRAHQDGCDGLAGCARAGLRGQRAGRGDGPMRLLPGGGPRGAAPSVRWVAGSIALAVCCLLCGSTPMMTMLACLPDSTGDGDRGRQADLQLLHGPLLSQAAVRGAGRHDEPRESQPEGGRRFTSQASQRHERDARSTSPTSRH